jgi:hypothetical protein
VEVLPVNVRPPKEEACVSVELLQIKNPDRGSSAPERRRDCGSSQAWI